MKVYVVVEHDDFETSFIMGVFKNKEDAECMRKQCEKDEMCLDGAVLEEYTLL